MLCYAMQAKPANLTKPARSIMAVERPAQPQSPSPSHVGMGVARFAMQSFAGFARSVHSWSGEPLAFASLCQSIHAVQGYRSKFVRGSQQRKKRRGRKKKEFGDAACKGYQTSSSRYIVHRQAHGWWTYRNGQGALGRGGRRRSVFFWLTRGRLAHFWRRRLRAGSGT